MRLAERDTVWTRDGQPVEELPDPFAPEPPPADAGSASEGEAAPPTHKHRRWVVWFYAISGLIVLTLVWLVLTAPLSRALEPLDDPALLLLSDDGHPIALRGAIKEAPVEVGRLNPLTPAAFVAIEDRRFLDCSAERNRTAVGALQQQGRVGQRLKRARQRCSDHQP